MAMQIDNFFGVQAARKKKKYIELAKYSACSPKPAIYSI
jgi:hypothetical protein